MKIDIEGYEMEVFRAIDWSASYRPKNIIMEFCDHLNRMNDTTDSCLTFLKDRGYEAFTIEGNPVQDCYNLPESNLWLKSC
jgi:hypothetical protein